jgi:hypothetical protein
MVPTLAGRIITFREPFAHPADPLPFRSTGRLKGRLNGAALQPRGCRAFCRSHDSLAQVVVAAHDISFPKRRGPALPVPSLILSRTFGLCRPCAGPIMALSPGPNPPPLPCRAEERCALRRGLCIYLGSGCVNSRKRGYLRLDAPAQSESTGRFGSESGPAGARQVIRVERQPRTASVTSGHNNSRGSKSNANCTCAQSVS